MSDRYTGSKLALIEAAGELFAELGVDGTSVRSIAKKAGLNIAAINYHFGSKEHLYTETLFYVLQCNYSGEKEKILKCAKSLKAGDIKGFEKTIYEITKSDFDHFLSKAHPSWHTHLVMRTFMKESEPLKTIVEKVFRPKHEAFIQIIKRVNPKITDEQAIIIAHSINGQTVFYYFCRIPMLLFLKQGQFDPEYFDNVAKYIAKTSAFAITTIEQQETK